MDTHTQVRGLWVLFLVLLAIPMLTPSSASSRLLPATNTADTSTASLSTARTLQTTSSAGAAPGGTGGTVIDVPGYPADGGDALAKEGEQCNSGGNLRPASCAPGLTCNITSPLPTVGTPGWNPDFAAVGTCVPASNATANLAKEGENCTTGVSAFRVGCEDGLYCDTSAAMLPPGTPSIPEITGKGVCKPVATKGELCYAGGVMVPPAEPDAEQVPRAMSTPTLDLSWSAPCASVLECYVLDPSPSTNDSLQIQNKMASLDMSTRFMGYCVNKSTVPAARGSQGSGTPAGVCKVGVPLAKAETPCQAGLACVAPSSVLQGARAGTVTYGVCTELSALVPRPGISLGRGNATDNSPAATNNNATTSPSSPAPPKSGVGALHRYWWTLWLAGLTSLLL